MRILHVNKFFDLHGGAEVYMHALIRAQTEAGHEVHAFSTRSDRNQPSRDAGLFVERFAMDKREGMVRDARKAIAFLWNREARMAMERMLDQVKPDVVHLHNIYHHLSTSILAPIRARTIPCVQTLHDYKIACPNYKMFTEGAPCERCKGGRYWNVVRHRCLAPELAPNVLAAVEMGFTKTTQQYEKTVRLFLCPSHFMKEKMEDWGQPPNKMRFVPNPAVLAETPAERGGGYVLYAGRLSREKGVMSFLEAAVKIPELPVKIAGTGPDDERLKSFVRSTGATHISFLGFIVPDELTKIRRRAEAIVLPTIMYENASGVLLEAMGDGIPCLATRIGGNPELVEDGANGFLAQPGDVEDWTRIIRRLLATTPEMRTKMGERGREKVRANHLWKHHLAKVEECYREAGVSSS
ncbi:MAG: glycosyltransferase family 4 protein [Patescibacteria group bacterium]